MLIESIGELVIPLKSTDGYDSPLESDLFPPSAPLLVSHRERSETQLELNMPRQASRSPSSKGRNERSSTPKKQITPTASPRPSTKVAPSKNIILEDDRSKTYDTVPEVKVPPMSFISRVIMKYNIEMGLSMLEPWERNLLHLFLFGFFLFSSYNFFLFAQWVRPYLSQVLVLPTPVDPRVVS